jgi:hypothetical protein
MSDQQIPDDKEFENDLKSYFNLTTGAEVPGGVQRMDAGKYSDAKPAATRRLMSGIGVVLAGAVAVGAVVSLRGTGTHSTPSLSPTLMVASGAAVAYDPGIGKVVLFGGSDANGHQLSDTWTWNGTAWTKLSTPTSPPAREGATLGWDPASKDLVLVGGTATTSGNAQTSTSCTGSVPPVSPGGVISGGSGASGSVSGQASGGTVVSGGPVSAGSGSSVSVSGSVPSPLASVSGSISVNGSAAVASSPTAGATTPAPSPSSTPAPGSVSISANGTGGGQAKGFGGCVTRTNGAASLNDTWTFDGTTWHQEKPAPNPVDAFGRVLMATDNTTNSLVLVSQSFSPAVLSPAVQACPVPAPGAPTALPVNCGTQARQINKVYVWRNRNWVVSDTLPGNVTALATDPSTGDLVAILSPEFAFSCGVAATTNTSAAPTIATAPCSAGTKATLSQSSKLLEWRSGSWTQVGVRGAPAASISLASADSGDGYLLVITSDGATWSFSHNQWTKLSESGPPKQALGLAVLADDSASASGQVLMFLPALGLAAPPVNGSVALSPPKLQGATSAATWIWSKAWKQVSGGAWPTPSDIGVPSPVPCPALAQGAGNATASTPPPGAVTICNGGQVQIGATP